MPGPLEIIIPCETWNYDFDPIYAPLAKRNFARGT